MSDLRRFSLVIGSALVVWLTIAISPVAAQNTSLQGRYAVSGTNSDSTSYTGTLDISAGGVDSPDAALYMLVWKIGDSTYSGYGIQHDNVLSVTYGDKACGLVVYKVQAGKLSGIYGGINNPKLGSEEATGPKPASLGNLSGNYAIKGTNADGSQYTGKLDISGAGLVYTFKWTIPNNPIGVGLIEGSTVSAAYGAGKDGCGIASYHITSDKTLVGIWATVANPSLGSELITPSAS